MDLITLYPPGGSPPAPSFIPLGSWLMGDPGPDFGAKGLIQSLESSNALTDGGRFSFRYAPPRKMSFPLILNPMYGVNRLANPGFETGTTYPWSLQAVASGYTATPVVAQATPAVGANYAVATIPIASGAMWLLGSAIPAPFAGLPSGEPMLLGARLCDFLATTNEAAFAYLFLSTNGGASRWYPDTPAPGYVFGFAAGTGTPNTGNFISMDLPPGWQQVGGIYSPALMASMLSQASSFRVEVVSFHPSGPGTASYGIFGVDEIEFRSAYQQRAVREWEGQLREYSTPGAYISVQPEGVPSQEAVFFDVLDGRWEPEYNIYENRAGVRKGTLFLDTQPFGYWPTEILLASAASVGYIGQLPVNGASVIGDVPPLAHVVIAPTVASIVGAGTWMSDMVALSLGGAPSFSAFVPPASITTAGGVGVALRAAASLTGDMFAPASQAMLISLASMSAAWDQTWITAAIAPIATALEPAYRGRFRVFSFVKIAPSYNVPMIVDAVAGPTSLYPAMATSNQLATAFLVDAAGFGPSPGYLTLDMGEITLPPAASGVQQGEALRAWAQLPATTNAVGSWQLWLGGFYLLPVDGAAGILARGLVAPTLAGAGISVVQQGALELNGNSLDSVIVAAGFPPSAPHPAQPVLDGRAYYRGISPRLGASTTQLVFLTADRVGGAKISGGTYVTAQANVEHAQVSVSYRPTFQFLMGV